MQNTNVNAFPNEETEYSPADPAYAPPPLDDAAMHSPNPTVLNPFTFGSMADALPALNTQHTPAQNRRLPSVSQPPPRRGGVSSTTSGRGRGGIRAVRPSERAANPRVDPPRVLPTVTFSVPPIRDNVQVADLVEDTTPTLNVLHARKPKQPKRLFHTHLNLREFVLSTALDNPVFTDFPVDVRGVPHFVHEISGPRLGFQHLQLECNCSCLETQQCDFYTQKKNSTLVLAVSANCYTHFQLAKFLEDFKEVYIAPIIFDMLHSNVLTFVDRTLMWQFDESDNQVIATTTDCHNYSTTQRLGSMIWIGQFDQSATQQLTPNIMRVRTDYEALCYEVVAGTNTTKQYTSLNRLILRGESDLTNRVYSPLRPSHFSQTKGNYCWSLSDATLEDPVNHGFQALVHLKVESIRSLGPLWLVKTKDITHNVPRHLVHELALEISGLPRDHATFASLLNKAKKKIKDFKSIANGELAMASVIATVMAFGQDLRDETDILTSFSNTHKETMSAHALALRLTPTTTTLKYYLLASVFSSLFAGYLIGKYRTYPSLLIALLVKKFKSFLIQLFTFRVSGVGTFDPFASITTNDTGALFQVLEQVVDSDGVTYLPGQFYRGVPSVFALFTCIIAPIWEESFKRYFPFGKHLLPWFEFLSKSPKQPQEVASGLVMVFMHYFWSRLPLPFGMMAHSLHNTHCIQQYNLINFGGQWLAEFCQSVRSVPWTPFVFGVNLHNAVVDLFTKRHYPGVGTIFGNRIISSMPELDTRNPMEYMVKVCTNEFFICNLFATLAPNSLGTILLPRLSPVPASNRLAKPKFDLSTDANEFIVVDPNYRKKLQTVHYIIASILFNSHVPCPFLLDQRVAIASLTRLMIDAPKPTAALAQGWDKHTARWCKLLIKHWVHVSNLQWLEHIPSTKKRQIFAAALVRLEENGFLAKLYNMMEHFIKDEKSVFDDADGTSRPIISMTPEKMAAYGRFFYELGLTMKKIWCKEWFTKNRIYFGSQNAEDIGAAYDLLMEVTNLDGFWIMVNGDDSCIFVRKDGKWLLYKNDMSRMDGHVRRDALTKENEFYKKLRMPVLARLAVRDIDAKIRSRYGLFIKLCRRLSGSGQTTVGNTNQNVVCINHCFDNDDISVPNLTARAAEMGFTAKFALCPEIQDLEFCSKLFWPTAEGTVLGAKVGRMLKKIGTMKVTKNTLPDYKAAINAHYNDNFHVPVVNITLKRILELLAGTKLGKVDFEEEFKIHVTKRHTCTEETWQFFEKRYGVSSLMVESYAMQLATVEALPISIRVDWLESVFDRDGA